MTTPQGVNAELAPWVRMTFPASALSDITSAPVGTPLLVSWLLFLGLLPFDRHVLILAEVGERHFVETSYSLLQKSWRHERTVTPDNGSACIVEDRLSVEPRIPLLRPLTHAVVRAIFRHRHKRLRLRFS